MIQFHILWRALTTIGEMSFSLYLNLNTVLNNLISEKLTMKLETAPIQLIRGRSRAVAVFGAELSAISTLVLTRVTAHDYPMRRACSQAQAF